MKSTGAPPPRQIELHMLAAFRVFADGAEVASDTFATRRSRELVLLLALARQHRLARDQVVDTLWPELDAEAGGANLRKAAHFARRALGHADAVSLRDGRVALLPAGTVVTDVARFEQAADAALLRGDRAACDAAAALYTGDLLPDALDESWIEAPRARLRGKFLQLLRKADRIERIAEEEPTDEAAHQALMRAAISSGQRTTGIRWYGRLRGALEKSLGVPPSKETERLYAECVAGLAPREHGFVGRGPELARVQQVFSHKDALGPAGVVLQGAAGIGKTALARRVVDLAKRDGWGAVFVAPSDPSQPYAVVVDVAEQLLRADRRLLEAIDGHTRGVLAALTPLARVQATQPGPLTRHQVAGALHALLVATRPGAPALLAVDDADAIDQASAEVLLQLVATGAPILTLLTLRSLAASPTLERGVARLLRHGRVASIAVGPLAASEIEGLIRGAADGPLDAALVDAWVRGSEGNPFLALELARAPRTRASAPLPSRTADAIAERLCDVDDMTLGGLRRLAVGPRAFDTAIAAALLDRSEAESFAILDRALENGVLEVVDARYRFRHAIVQEALAEQLPPHRRVVVHREAAANLATANAPAALVAHHWVEGGRMSEAAPWLARAARNAFGVAAFMDALEHLEPLLAHDPTHAEGLRLRAESFDAIGDPRTLVAYDAAVSAAAPDRADDLRAKRALAQLKMGDPGGALEAVRGVAPKTVDGRLAEALTYSGAAALGFADPALGTAKAAECRRLALLTGDAGATVIASWAQAAAAHARGELHGSVWADLWETHHVSHLAMRVFDGHLCITQRFLYGARPYPHVIDFANALAAEASRLGAARGHAFAVTLRGEAKLLSGHLDDAAEDLVAGARLHRAIGGATGEALSLQRQAELAMYRGKLGEAWTLVHAALDVARHSEIGFHLLDRIYGTRIVLARDPDAALAAVHEAEESVRGPLETCPGCRITFAVPAAIAAARAGALELANDYGRKAEWLAEVVMRLPAWDAALDEVRGHLASASGDQRGAAERFDLAARRFDQAGHPLDARRCRARDGSTPPKGR
jgi:DNA-binding SARP family transcriptional activator